MKESVDLFIRRHGILHSGETVLVAVSGGADSLALLHYLSSIRSQWRLRIMAVSVDHQLRGDQSRADVQFVKDVCREWNIDFVDMSVDVAWYKQQHGKGTQEAARELRYQVFNRVMNTYQADVLALGHHGDDQIETVLMRLVQRSRSGAVTGMPIARPFGRGRLIRPFLSVSKQDILQYCASHHIDYREDPTNQDPAYTRNAFRLQVLPFLKTQNPQLHRHIQSYSERVRAEEEYLDSQAEKVLDSSVTFTEKPVKVELKIPEFSAFPFALQRRAFHLILNYLFRGAAPELSYAHEESFFLLLSSEKPNVSLDFPNGLHLIREYDHGIFQFTSVQEPESYAYRLQAGEEVRLPDGSRLRADLTEELDKQEGPFVYLCDSHHVSFPLYVRTRKDGDRIRPMGMKGSKKVKDIFIDEKIPAAKRKTWPIITDANGNILWIAGLKKGEAWKTATAGTWLRLHYHKREKDL
ncbi:tRNA lysidine(34) synthetase TilS [Thalassobacillus sp. CUG 92003]|uniref:tRNA lysidine(34) synthetase TilS n=1 Tax=Thalassobacillus sp. CUG 92003 TaxID=2736641 RepID=UPI0015E67428|nr:tRNA lysidine(34) synthetase TilS [Thalassobacillus sp. CUG 92003]